ncbi:U4/U6.U5 tri-snRNP-associated protein 1 [Toxocara canis]|uniref:U4/U6.U5 tri-snRNP-associated protein 1 n=1 Tax=Toxocara canis TaxID=6265 RepID=A0A0B2W4J9_TOXCA|nr:U4/U6.U5 tri-snRNP-associated protein 1 [Toxocara canis]
MEFVHKAPEHIGDKKRAEEVKEKLQTIREKRRIYDKVLKAKGLTESDSDEDAATWVKKNRELEEEKKRAEERAKLLDDMDAEFGIDSIIEDDRKRKVESQKKRERKQKSNLGGVIVGHAKDDFLEGNETVLILEDRSVLDDGDEVLVNPNLIENKRHEKNAELRKRKDPYQAYSEEVDELGMLKPKGLLSKYDEELEGEERQMFRLDESGEVDIEKERQEMEVRKNLFMANKKLESLETQKYKVASEFYTEEEMISFRRPKSKKDGKKMRKRKEKILKADDLIPEDTTVEDASERAAKLAAHLSGTASTHKEVAGEDSEVNGSESKNEIKVKLEDGELDDDGVRKEKWQAAETSGLVDIQRLNEFVRKEQQEEEESDDDEDLVGGVDLTGIVIEDDAEEELTSILDKARKIRQAEVKKEEVDVDSAAKVHEMLAEHAIKQEPMDEDGETRSEQGVVIDSTMEYCRNLGEIPTYGLAGNRKDVVDVSEVKETVTKKEVESDDEKGSVDDVIRRWRQKGRDRERQQKGKWMQATTSVSAEAESTSRHRSASEGDMASDDEPYNVLGEERDVTKGMAAMLKLAAEKGYLDSSKPRKANGPSLKHLENKRFSQIEIGKYDIEEKYTKKLERMGTTGTGPVRPFPEKNDYKPDIRITYIDERGREMESKDAFRVLSWKFHGKGPGKKQIEKRQAKQEKKELMKKMNSMDTPLGTLQKQLRKQEALQTPYIVLSGSGRDTGYVLIYRQRTQFGKEWSS